MNFPSQDITTGDRIATGWVQTNEARNGVRYVDRRRGPLGEIAGRYLRRRTNTGEGMFPFKVYLAQMAFDYATMIATYPDPTTWWTIFLVRGGRVWDKALYGGGSDGYDTDPYSDYFSNIDDQGHPVAPIVVPADEEPYYLWIEVLVDGTPKLRQGDDPSSDTDSITQWTNWPDMDGIHWPIAEIDTTAPYEATVRQIANCDFLYKFREVTDCVEIDDEPTTVYRQACVSDWYTTPMSPITPTPRN